MNETDTLERRLRVLGLHQVDRIITHTNRTVMVSLGMRRVLRLHQGYSFAPDRVLLAIIRFLDPRLPTPLRRAAQREFLDFPVEQHAPTSGPSRRERPRPGDLLLLHRLRQLHERFNAKHFGGALTDIPIRLSGRMRRRLGELSIDLRDGRPLEIALSRRHVARHAWTEVEHTLLHEMVHQWQAESGLPVDHGPAFREKAAELGIQPHASRRLPGQGEEAAPA
jgi:SprT-like family